MIKKLLMKYQAIKDNLKIKLVKKLIKILIHLDSKCLVNYGHIHLRHRLYEDKYMLCYILESELISNNKQSNGIRSAHIRKTISEEVKNTKRVLNEIKAINEQKLAIHFLNTHVEKVG